MTVTTMVKQVRRIEHNALHNPLFDSEPNRKKMPDGMRKWSTNCNWIPRYEYQEDERNDQYVISRGGVANPAGQEMSLTQAIEEYGLFDLEDYWSMARIQVGEFKDSPRRWKYRSDAVSKNLYRSIQINPKSTIRFLVIDIDNNDSRDIFLDRYLPTPSLFVFDPARGTGHAVYAIKNPVLVSDKARRKPIRYLAYVRSLLNTAIKGDSNYTGHFMKNPYHTDYITYWGTRNNVYSLKELERSALDSIEHQIFVGSRSIEYDNGMSKEEAEAEIKKTIEKHVKAKKLDDQNDGRNKAIFDKVRKWAYRNRSKAVQFDRWALAVRQRCVEYNEVLANSTYSHKGPLDNREVASIANSIARWTWTNPEMTERGMWTDEDRRKSAITNSQEAFDRALLETQECFSGSRRKRSIARGRIYVDEPARKIYLPSGVTRREYISTYKQVFGRTPSSVTLSYLVEDLEDTSLIISSHERHRIEHGIRQLKDLSIDEQLLILEDVMNSYETYSDLDKKHRTDANVVCRLVWKYRHTPWTLIPDVDSCNVDEETRELMKKEAQERWRKCHRNGGNVKVPFVSAVDPDKDNDELLADKEERDAYIGIAKGNYDGEFKHGLLHIAPLIARGFDLKKISQGDFSVRDSFGKLDMELESALSALNVGNSTCS